MDTKTIFATLALLGSGTLAGCAAGGGDTSEVPRARKARGGQGSCGGSAKAEASCSKNAAAKAAKKDDAAPAKVAAATDDAPADVAEAAAPAPAEEEEVEMLCGAPGEKRCA